MYHSEYEKDIIREDYLAVLNLLGALFRLTSQDLRHGTKAVKKEAKEFLSSDWFNDICDYTNLNPETTRNLIRYSKVKSRTNYE